MQHNLFWKICITVVSVVLCIGSAFQGFAATTQSSTSTAPQILWWYDLQAPSFGSAATGDIDNDGMLEIVFGTYFNDET